MNVLENNTLERRVAVCSINDCCPFRSNLRHVGDGCQNLGAINNPRRP